MIKYSYYADVPDDFTGVCELTGWNAVCHMKECKFHRTDGPAVEWKNGDREWYVDGNLHRLDGPAVEHIGTGNCWYVNGKEYSKEKFNSLPEVIMHKEGLDMFL